MSLSTPSRFADAKKLLESLDLNSLTRELLKPSHRERSFSEQLLELEKSLSLPPVADLTQPLPLHVTLSSLVAGSSARTSVNRVYSLAALCHDPKSSLHHLSNNLAIIFAAAGLFKQSSLTRIRTESKENKFFLPTVALIVLAPLGRGQNLVPSPTQPGRFETYNPGIDPRDLTRTFKDFVWAENIRLERLSICPLGVANQLLRGLDKLPEACSVPL